MSSLLADLELFFAREGRGSQNDLGRRLGNGDSSGLAHTLKALRAGRSVRPQTEAAIRNAIRTSSPGSTAVRRIEMEMARVPAEARQDVIEWFLKTYCQGEVR